MVNNLPAMQEAQVWSLGCEDLLKKEMATHSSILSWRIPWTEEPGGLQSVKWQESDNLATKQQVYYFPGNKLMHPNEQHPQTHLTTTTI